MILLAGGKIKYRGKNEQSVLDELEQSLRGHCIRRKAAIVITRTVVVQIKMRVGGSPCPQGDGSGPLNALGTTRSTMLSSHRNSHGE